jgi:hypothetical protein
VGAEDDLVEFDVRKVPQRLIVLWAEPVTVMLPPL